MRLVSLAVMLATALVACTREPAVAGVSPVEPVDVSGIPSEIRVLVAVSRSHYYLENGVARGLTPQLADQFEQWLNAQSKSATFDVELIETPQDALIKDLLAGKGDVAANLLLTFERDDQVAFAKPVHTGIRELVVTGPNQPALVSLEDVGDRIIHVRKSSDHYASLVRLNDQLTKINRPPAKIVIDSAATDEDLLELVNLGTIPATLFDDYLFDAWRARLTNITANKDVAVSQDGVLAWVTRKDTPRLLAVMNAFFSLTREG